MTLFDRLFLVATVIVFAWQVVIPLWRGRPVFPLLRKAKRKGIKA